MSRLSPRWIPKRRFWPKMPELIRSRPNGGHLTHSRIKGEPVALCGYCPSSPSTTQMIRRHGWAYQLGIQPCKKCEQKETELRRRCIIDTGQLKR